MKPKRHQAWCMVAGLLPPVLVILSIWYAPVSHHRVTVPELSGEIVLAAREAPPEAILRELGSLKHALIPPLGRLLDDPVAEAEALLARCESEPGNACARGPLSFDPALLRSLDYAMLGAPRTLLKAYEVSGEERYFSTAHDFIQAWAHFESKSLLPRGLLWNDHALAARAITLAEYWRLFRKHHSYNDAEARSLLRLVVATAHRLADPAQYTLSSNHGTMQNLGLMHLSLAFPALEGFPALGRLGLSRLIEQNSYMISPGGVVLEHSAGYHRLGMELLGIALRYQSLRSEPLPDALTAVYQRTLDVYTQLRAADESLPALGDTSITAATWLPLTARLAGSGGAMPMTRDRAWATPRAESLFPYAGYAIWWSAGGMEASPVQSTVSWSHFPRHGHKHADELSINIRSGQDHWWRSIGYWPLQHPDRRAAASWTGSNAPHLAGEAYDSPRATRLRSYAANSELRFIDLEREGPGGFRVRRQLLHIQPDTWLVVDSFNDPLPDRKGRVVWTTGKDIRITATGAADMFTLQLPAGDRSMHSAFSGSPGYSTRIVRGEHEPFLGWVESEYSGTPADAIAVELPSAGAWVAQYAMLAASGQPPAASALDGSGWRDGENWRFRVGEVSIVRDGGRLQVERGLPGSPPVALTLAPAPDTVTWIESSGAAYERAKAGYSAGFQDLIPYRVRVSYALALLLLIQAVAFLLVGSRQPLWCSPLAVASVVGWALIAGWLHLVYFAV